MSMMTVNAWAEKIEGGGILTGTPTSQTEETECNCGAAEGELHKEGCPLYVAPVPENTCTGDENCTAEEHKEGCPKAEPKDETPELECNCGVAEGELHKEGCLKLQALDVTPANLEKGYLKLKITNGTGIWADALTLTDVTVTLVGQTDQKTYTITLEEVNKNGETVFETIPKQTYNATVVGTGEDGTSYEGTGTIFMFYIGGSTASIGVAPKKPDDMVTVRVDLNNSFDNATIFDLDAEKDKTIFFTGEDGTTYPLTSDKGYYSATLPKGKSYTLSIKCKDYHGTEFGDKSGVLYYFEFKQDYGSEWFERDYESTGKTIIVNLGEDHCIKKEDPDLEKIKVAIEVKDRDTNQLVPDCPLTIIPKMHTSELHPIEARTDKSGSVTVELPIVDLYTVKSDYPDRAPLNRTIEYKEIEDKEITIFLNSSVRFDAHIYAYDEKENLISEWTDTNIWRSNPSVAGLSYEDIAKCIKAEAFLADGTELEVELSDSGDSSSDSPSVKIKDVSQIPNQEVITVNFYYDYTDDETTYPLLITHRFVGANGAAVHTEGKQKDLAAGTTYNIDALTSDENPFIVKKDIPGYENGVWRLGSSVLKGGSLKSIKGYLHHENYGANNISVQMIHDTVSLTFTYRYAEQSLQYFPNAVDATGTMETVICGAGDKMTVAESGFTRAGYTFAGWNTKADGTGTAYQPGDIFMMDHADVVLYAQWKENPVPTPDPTPDPTPTPDPDPTPDPGNPMDEGGEPDPEPRTTIDDEPTPLADQPETVTIEDGEVPLTDAPELVTIDDEQVPLKDNPNTGDASSALPALAAAAVSLTGLAVLCKKKEK